MKKKFAFIVLLLAFIAGCAAPKAIFYWGDYSNTLYDYKKSPDEKTLQVHKKSLLNIINNSPKFRHPVPPGIYAEYGMMLLKDGNEKEGMDNLDKELALYPESAVFIKRLKDEFVRGKK